MDTGDFILISGHRVGSRWLARLLSSYYGLDFYGELIGIGGISREYIDYHYLNNGTLIKLHPFRDDIVEHIREILYPIKIVCIVRNPRDRLISYAFHYRYYPDTTSYMQKQCSSDYEAILKTAKEDHYFIRENILQNSIMSNNSSSRNYTKDSDCIWTTYEWLLENTKEEFSRIIKFISNEKIYDYYIDEILRENSFKNLSKGRNNGEEDRLNVRQRKGIVGDYNNWRTDELDELTKEYNDKYWETVNAIS